MAKRNTRSMKNVSYEDEFADEKIINKIVDTKHRLKCKNEKQKEFSRLITEKEIVIAAGPAGVGKSYVAIARALELVQNKSTPYQKIVISKPIESAGENYGHLPGTLEEKMEPVVASSIDILDKIVGKPKRMQLQESDIIQVEPLGFLRGKTIDNSILVMEEVQNMSPGQVKTLLTRIGKNTKFILSGDLDQSDKYRSVKDSGLYDAMEKHRNIDDIGFFEFGIEDIVRNPIITKILKNYITTNNDIYAAKIEAQHIKKEEKIKPLINKSTLNGQQKQRVKKKPTLIRRIKIYFKRNFRI